MKKLNLINIKVNKSLYFFTKKAINPIIRFNTKKYFCAKFFDNEFKVYYKSLIEGAQKGKIKEFEGLQSLESEYKINGLFTENEEYNIFKWSCLQKQRERKDDLNSIYSYITDVFFFMEQLLNEATIFGLIKKLNENDIDMLLLKNKINKFDKSNKIGKLFIKKLLSRYFADYIIKILIKNYPRKFNSIKLSLANYNEIITTYGFDIINDKNEIN